MTFCFLFVVATHTHTKSEIIEYIILNNSICSSTLAMDKRINKRRAPITKFYIYKTIVQITYIIKNITYKSITLLINSSTMYTTICC